MLCGETDDIGAPYNDDIYDALLRSDLPTTSSQLEVFHFFGQKLNSIDKNCARAILMDGNKRGVGQWN